METAILSVIAGAIISYFIAKWQMKRNKITHFSLNSYDIGKGLSDEFPEFKLHFAGEALANNVMVLKGGFMNTGRNDINGLKGENDIKLILPDGCKVKAITVEPSVEGLTVLADKDNENENIILFGINEIFRTDEFFKYTAIIETSDEIDDLDSELKFSHRISNTEKIAATYIRLQNNKMRKRMAKLVIFLSLLILLMQAVHYSFTNLKYNVFNNNNDQEVNIFIDVYSNLYASEGLYIPHLSGKKISSNELINDYKIVPETEFKLTTLDVVSLVSCAILAFIYIFWAYYMAWGKNSHIISVLKENDK